MEKLDPFTQESFTPTRSNQQYANRQNQIRCNNFKAKQKRDLKKEINDVLDRNRKALGYLLGENKSSIINKSEMLSLGFNFACQTHNRMINDKKYIFIYEYGYSPLNQSTYDIIKYA